MEHSLLLLYVVLFKQNGIIILGFVIGGLGMLISLLILYFKAALELEEFHKNCTLKQNWEQPFKKVKNLTLILSISLLSIIGFFLMFINLVNINPI
ncbi:hypothetical protein THJ032_11170 [Campylobacter jejuni]|nr:hypothetical protein THJ032_11170 [Campylobacter jejuni]